MHIANTAGALNAQASITLAHELWLYSCCDYLLYTSGCLDADALHAQAVSTTAQNQPIAFVQLEVQMHGYTSLAQYIQSSNIT